MALSHTVWTTGLSIFSLFQDVKTTLKRQGQPRITEIRRLYGGTADHATKPPGQVELEGESEIDEKHSSLAPLPILSSKTAYNGYWRESVLVLDRLVDEHARIEDWERAQDAALKSVALWRNICAVQPDDGYLLASQKLAICCGHLGLYEKARDASSEAVSLLRVLYMIDQDRYRSKLAHSLLDLGRALEDLSLYSKALRAFSEAYDWWRVLYMWNPTEYCNEFAFALYSLSTCSYRLGEMDKAFMWRWEAEAVYDGSGPILLRRPMGMQLKLAIQVIDELTMISDTCLDDLKRYGDELIQNATLASNRSPDIVAFYRAALHIRRRLHAKSPHQFSQDYLEVQLQFASNRMDNGRFSEAHDILEQALQLYRVTPGTYRLDLIVALERLYDVYAASENWNSARDVISNAIDVWYDQCSVQGDGRPQLVYALSKHGHALAALGMDDQFCNVASEAVLHCQTLDNSALDRDAEHLTGILWGIFNQLRSWERDTESLAIITECVRLQTHLYTLDPPTHRHRLATLLRTLARTFQRLGRYLEAHAAAIEAVGLFSVLYKKRPDRDRRKELIDIRIELGEWFKDAELYTEARDQFMWAAELQRMDRAIPTRSHSQLISTYRQLSACSRRLGYSDTALILDLDAMTLLDITDWVCMHRDRRVGSGGYGVVYEAEWQVLVDAAAPLEVRLPSQLVVKVILGASVDALEHPGASRVNTKVLREINTSHHLDHRNIVRLEGYINLADGIGIVSHFFPRGSVLKHLRDTPDADREQLCHDIARGLCYLHALDEPVIHGDLKPDNVVVHEDGHAALCDFGLSRLTSNPVDSADLARSGEQFTGSSLTSTSFGGTLLYSAPEFMLYQDQATPESDVYSLACTCAEVLSGERPFAWIPLNARAKIEDALATSQAPYDGDAFVRRFPHFAVLLECWNAEPSKRPSMREVCDRMGQEAALPGVGEIKKGDINVLVAEGREDEVYEEVVLD